jgi:tetratricopeptide (TPR) repeat protein
MRCHRTCLGVPVNLKDDTNYDMMARSIFRSLEDGDVNNAFGFARSLGEYVRNAKLQDAYLLTAQALYAQVKLAQGFPEEALDTAKRAALMAKTMPLVYQEQLLENIFVWALAAYDLQNEEFNRVAAMYSSFAPLDCRCYRDLRLVVLEGLVELAAGRRSKALDKFGLLEQYEHVSQYWTQVGRLCRCECALEMEDLDSAVAFLQQADMLFSNGGIALGALQLWLGRLPNTAKLIEREFPFWPTVAMPHAAHAQAIVRKRPDAALRIDAFGRGRVQSHGQETDFGEENRQQALALLTYLAMRPGGVELERVMLDLWPAAKARPDGRPSYSSFNKARAFAVEACGFDHVSVHNGIAEVPEDAWVDAVAFEAAFDKASRVPLGNALSQLEYARSLYKGTFLLGGRLLWVADQQRHFMEMAAWISWKIAAIYANDGQLPQAQRYLKESLDIDPIFDRAMMDLVRTMDQLGTRSAAHVLLDSYIKRLRAIFRGAPPAADVLALKERFMTEAGQLTMPFTKIELLEAARRPAKTLPEERAEAVRELEQAEGWAGVLGLKPISAAEAAAASWEVDEFTPPQLAAKPPQAPQAPQRPARRPRPPESFLQEDR